MFDAKEGKLETIRLVRSKDRSAIHAMGMDCFDEEPLKRLGGRRHGLRWSFNATPVTTYKLLNRIGKRRVKMSQEIHELLIAGSIGVKQANNFKDKDSSGFPQPRFSTIESYPHQIVAYHFARSLRAAMLNMDMGTGKTKVAIDLIQNTPNIRSALIVCPIRIIPDVWKVQLPKYLQNIDQWRIVYLNEGTLENRALQIEDAYNDDRSTIVVTGYETIVQEPLRSALVDRIWDIVELDESHHIKRPGGKISNTLYQIGRRAEYRYCFTGTVIPTTPLDAYAQYRFLDSGVFGTNYTRFQARYALMGGFSGYQILGYQNEEELSKKIFTIGVRIEEDVIKLPPTVTMKFTTPLEPKARNLYLELEKEMTAEVKSGRLTVSNALAKFTRLQEISSGYATYNVIGEKINRRTIISDAKLTLLRETIGDIANTEPIVVFARFKKDIKRIRIMCHHIKRPVYEISSKRDDLGRWKFDTRGSVLVVQSQSGIEGIDLSRAKYAIYYSFHPSLGDYKQSRKRLHRPGQTRSVVFIHLMCQGTVDVRMYRAFKNNQRVIDYIIDELRRGVVEPMAA